jgi:hypothetical protein
MKLDKTSYVYFNKLYLPLDIIRIMGERRECLSVVIVE